MGLSLSCDQWQTAPSPVDRGKCGTALHLACDARAMPLGVVVTAAKANDGCQPEDVRHALVVHPPGAESSVPGFDPRDYRSSRPYP